MRRSSDRRGLSRRIDAADIIEPLMICATGTVADIMWPHALDIDVEDRITVRRDMCGRLARHLRQPFAWVEKRTISQALSDLDMLNKMLEAEGLLGDRLDG